MLSYIKLLISMPGKIIYMVFLILLMNLSRCYNSDFLFPTSLINPMS